MIRSKGALKTSYIAIVVILIIVIAAIAIYFATMPKPTPTPTPTTPISPTPTPTTPASPTPTPTPTTSPPPPGLIPFRVTTSTPGSGTQKMMLEMTMVLKREMPKYDFLALTVPGYIAGLKMYCTGDAEAAYAYSIQAVQLYTLTGAFKGFEAKRIPSLLFTLTTFEYGIAIHQRDLGKITKWSDLDGKTIFMYPPAWGAHIVYRDYIFPALGIKPKFVEIDFEMVGTALTKGDIVATGVYTSGGGRDLPPWVAEMTLTTPIAILNPTPDELAKLEAKGIKLFKVDLTKHKPFKTDVKAEFMYTAVLTTILFTDDKVFPEEDAYNFLKVIEKNIRELESIDPAFGQLAEDFVGLQLLGVEDMRSYYPNVPIHPGLVKYLKEMGKWK